MKIEYIRNLMGSYMVVEQKAENEEWEQQMIAHNRINCVLFAESMEENGDKSLWFNITGKQALDVVLEKNELKAELLCRLLRGVYEAAEALEAHLLRSDAIMLLPECIFMDSASGRISFCYYPGSEETTAEQFQRWVEFLLTKTDHRDGAAVEMAYGLYERTGRDGFSLRMLRDLICFPYPRDELQDGGAMGTSGEKERIVEQEEHDESVMEETTVNETDPERLVVNTSVYKRLQKKISEWFSAVTINRLFTRPRKKGNAGETFLFEPEEEEEVPVSEQTVLLSDLTRPAEGILRYEGNGMCADLEISDVPYLIGSGDLCDGCIRSSTVSRKHARITRVEDVYFIEDLNSANGTHVGGNLLNCRTRVSLQKNEIVFFADEKFRFI